MEALLGTAAQRSGTGQFADVDPRLTEFTSRYAIDPVYQKELVHATGSLVDSPDPWTSMGVRKRSQSGLSKLSEGLGTFGIVGQALSSGPGERVTGGDYLRGGQTIDQYWQTNLGNINSILDEAETAARQGDFERAEDLKAQADEILGSFPAGVQEAFNLQRDIADESIAAVSNPMARIVGNKIGRAMDLQSRGSEEYKKTFQDLTGDSIEAIRHGVTNSERVIAAEQRTIERQVKDLSLRRGGSGNRQADAAILARAADQAAFRRAQVHSQAAIAEADILSRGKTYVETFREKYAVDAVTLGRAFISGTPGVRDEFNNILANLAQAESDSLERLGDQWWASYRQYEQAKDLKRAANLEAALTIIGTAGTIAAGPVGTSGAGAGTSLFSGLFS